MQRGEIATLEEFVERPEITVVQPGTGETYLNLGSLVTIHVPKSATGGEYAVLEFAVPPEAGPPLHTHPETELIYVLEGSLDAHGSAGAVPVSAGALVVVPPRAAHGYRNTGQAAARTLSVYLPGDAEDFFRAAGQPVKPGEPLPNLDVPASLDPAEVKRALALATTFGMELVGGNSSDVKQLEVDGSEPR